MSSRSVPDRSQVTAKYAWRSGSASDDVLPGYHVQKLANSARLADDLRLHEPILTVSRSRTTSRSVQITCRIHDVRRCRLTAGRPDHLLGRSGLQLAFHRPQISSCTSRARRNARMSRLAVSPPRATEPNKATLQRHKAAARATLVLISSYRSMRLLLPDLIFIQLQNRHERFLRDLHRPDHLHALLAGLLLLKKFAFSEISPP